MASVCSAAVITFDWGALATTTPRLVAASTSTLSTPTPARPTALRRSARSSSPSSQSTPSTTSKPASRSTWMPDSPIFSLTRTFTSVEEEATLGGGADRHARLEEDALGRGHPGTELDLVPQLAQRHLKRG